MATRPFGERLRQAELDERRLNRAVLRRYDDRTRRLEEEEGRVQRDLSAGVERATSQAFGRRLGRARGGGAVRMQAQLQSDLTRQAGEARRSFREQIEQNQMDKLTAERAMMKDKNQLQVEMKQHADKLDELYDDATLAGVMNDTKFKKDVRNYINEMGLMGQEAADVLQMADDRMKKAFFTFSFGE